MRSLAEARSRWDITFARNANLSDLRVAARRDTSDNPCQDGLRSVCWKSFLVFENLDRSTWPKTIRDSRSAYASLKNHFLKVVENADAITAVDPLTEDENSPWNTLRQDEVLRGEILQDVVRCMPENQFFREPTAQSILLDILFIFCKLNADVGYRQGMHELLAPVLWVVSCDAIDPDDINGLAEHPDEKEALLRSTLDPSHIEHDTFTLFCIIMQPAKSFYEIASNSQQSTAPAPHNSPIVERSKRIHEKYLRRTDPELTDHLTAIDILPQIFVIRWIRLLFGREFPFNDILRLWDVLFAEDPMLDLIDLVCVAMLIRIRWQLLEADYSQALALLLRYPIPEAPHGPTTFLDDALYLRHNLSIQGGIHLITKYAGRGPTSVHASVHGSRRGRGLHTPKGSVDLNERSPLRSPTRYLHDSGGIEGILQEAAKNVYRRSEKWGVGQVLRGAVQGLQAANNSPRLSMPGMRWSLDDGRVTPNNAEIDARVKTLEERNKTLAKMLQNAMEELSEQSKKFEEAKIEAAANALTLSIAKLHFVHVYLDNSSLPLVSENTKRDSTEASENPEEATIISIGKGDRTESSSATDDALAPSSSTDRSTSSTKKLQTSPSHSTRGSPTRHGRRRPPPSRVAATKAEDGVSQKPLESPFQRPRPSLTQSSFSWMLGEDGSRPAFGSALPFSPEKERKSAAWGKAGFLFGDDGGEGTHPNSGGPKRAKDREEEEDGDGFTMGTLKGIGNG